MNRSNSSTTVDVAFVTRAPEVEGERIPAPTEGMGFTRAQIIAWHRDQAILNADPRTAGNANRPARLVEQVLRDANATPVNALEGVAKLQEGAVVVVLEPTVQDPRDYSGIATVIRTDKADVLVDIRGTALWVNWRRVMTLDTAGGR